MVEEARRRRGGRQDWQEALRLHEDTDADTEADTEGAGAHAEAADAAAADAASAAAGVVACEDRGDVRGAVALLEKSLACAETAAALEPSALRRAALAGAARVFAARLVRLRARTLGPRQPPAEAAPAVGIAASGGSPLAETAGSSEAAHAPTPAPTAAPAPRLADLVGVEEAKESLLEAIVLPRAFAHIARARLPAPSCVLLFGPPGTGKTTLVAAAAAQAAVRFRAVAGSDILSHWFGASERAVHDAFRADDGDCDCVVVFFDEVDSFLRARSAHEDENTRRIKNQFLLELDRVAARAAAGGSTTVVVAAATNRPFDLDAAVIRRFERRVHVRLPGADARREILRTAAAAAGTALSPDALARLAERTDGFSGSDLRRVAEDAAMRPWRELQRAAFWRPAQAEGGLWTPCGPDVPDATRTTLCELVARGGGADAARVKPPRMPEEADFFAALEGRHTTADKESVAQCEAFASRFGSG